MSSTAPATATSRPVNFDAMLDPLKNALSSLDIKPQVRLLLDCLDSSAFLNVSTVSFRSMPIAFLGDKQMIKEYDNRLSCSVRYLEAALMGVASLVYNVFFTVFFTAASLVTLGQVHCVRNEMRKRCIHAALAAASIGIGLAGVVSPKLGIQANGATALAAGAGLYLATESRLIRNICQAYQRSRAELQRNFTECVRRDDPAHLDEVAPFFNYLDTHLNESVQSFPNLLQVIGEARRRFPRIFPIVNPQAVLDMYRRSTMASSVLPRI